MDRVAFETARLELARLRVKPGAGGNALETALKLASRTLTVERVGFWEFDPGATRLSCRLQYTASSGEYTGGDVLTGARYPTYWAALRAKRVIAAHDALHDPATAELGDSYLRPLEIVSMLDAPVFRAGELIGVVCHEHVGRPRSWTREEINFASAVADLMSMILEQADRLDAQEALRVHIAGQVAAAKLSVLEGLSRAIAHDFANLITAVELVARRLHDHGGEDADLASSLESVAKVGGDLLGQLRRFGARTSGTPQVLPLRQVVERIAPILRTLTRGAANLEVALELDDGDTSSVTADKLEQIILNLTLNARDAIRIHGTIQLRARRDGDALVIEVVDDGEGMPPEVATRIWEPYFTTKSTGTGLGLATVKSIVDEAGGAIAVASVPGQGTTFRVRLPRQG